MIYSYFTPVMPMRCFGLLLLLLLSLAWPATHAFADDRFGIDPTDVMKVIPFPVGGDFELVSYDGPVTLSALRGKVVLLYFGYASCPDICPTTLSNLAVVMAKLTPIERRQTVTLFVSVDPERDSLGMLKDYVGNFDLPAIGLTASPDVLAEVAERYGVQFDKVVLPNSALGYVIDHSAAIYLIDRQGSLRQLLRHAAPVARYVYELRRLLAEP